MIFIQIYRALFPGLQIYVRIPWESFPLNDTKAFIIIHAAQVCMQDCFFLASNTTTTGIWMILSSFVQFHALMHGLCLVESDDIVINNVICGREARNFLGLVFYEVVEIW